ncbi:MAG: energy transducer TonB [Bacteroidota bacterium]
MFKTLFIFLAGMVLVQEANAQAPKSSADTLLYYVKNNGNITTKDSSDFVMLIMPNDPTNKKSLYPVMQFYRNGKRRLIASSSTHSINVIFEGPYRIFFSDGHLKSTSIYKNGHVVGPVTEYYPNGKVYTIKVYDKSAIKYLECRDSTGVVLAENGNGIWREFDPNFKITIKQAHVLNGTLSDKWQPIVDTSTYAYYDKTGPIDTTTNIKPTYYDDKTDLQKLLTENLNYPKTDLENNVNGRVTLSLVVEKDGALTHLKVIQAPSIDLGEEAIRLTRLSMPWTPSSRLSDGFSLRSRTTFKLDFYCWSKTSGGVQPVLNIDTTETYKDMPEYLRTSKLTSKLNFLNYSTKNDEQFKNTGEVFSSSSLDQAPTLPSGASPFPVLLTHNIKLPKEDRENGVSGKVTIVFIVELNGSISNLAVSGPSQTLINEVIRVIKLCPKWSPGIKNGKPVRSIYNIPITITTDNEY